MPTLHLCIIVGLLLCLLLITTVVQAQFELSGSVKDGITGEPLTGVHIMLLGKLTGTITDVKGDYLLKTETLPPFTVQVSMIGFEEQDI